jgi:hypothetical protein
VFQAHDVDGYLSGWIAEEPSALNHGRSVNHLLLPITCMLDADLGQEVISVMSSSFFFFFPDTSNLSNEHQTSNYTTDIRPQKARLTL